MEIVEKKPVMVFRKDCQYGALYSIGLSKKNQNGSYENGYLPVKFRKDIEIEDRTNIYIKKSWLSFYKDKEGKTIIYLFIHEFETVGQTIDRIKEESKEPTKDGFDEFRKEADLSELDNSNIINDPDLPF